MRSFPASLLMLVAVAGCPNGGGDGRTFSTNVPAGAQVENLSSPQATQLCDDIVSYLDGQFDTVAFCQAAAVASAARAAAQQPSLTDAELQQGCAQIAQDLCTRLNPNGGTGAFTMMCGTTPGCSATVAQVSTCITDSATSLLHFEQMFPSCAMITRARLATVNPDPSPMEPASCTTLDDSCPGFGPMLDSAVLGGT